MRIIFLHGGKDQHDRLDVLKQFREGSVNILIATDVSARGIDIPDVDQVVNYDLPEVAENYVHRVGRTGRGDRKGKATSFCSPEEKPVLDEIESFPGKPIPVLAIGKDKYKETLITHNDRPDKWKTMMEDIEKAEKWRKKGKHPFSA